MAIQVISSVTDTQKAALDAKIPLDVVSQREGGNGRKLDYLEGWYVIARMNEVFGQGNWGYNTEEMRLVFEGKVGDKEVAHYVAKVTVFAGGTMFVDYGYGDGTDKYNRGKAHELAVKEAVTDGIKRACKNFGSSMGLALYDKSRENVDAEPKARAASAEGATAIKPRSSKGTAKGNTSTPAPIGSSTESSTAAPTATANGKAPNRDELNNLISSTSRVVIAKKLYTIGTLKEFMKQKYGTEDKAKLNDEQAVSFLAYLDNLNTAGVTANA